MLTGVFPLKSANQGNFQKITAGFPLSMAAICKYICKSVQSLVRTQQKAPANNDLDPLSRTLEKSLASRRLTKDG
ncbi:hypothetical protein, partial [Paenibacillus contaminans]|uniref:hypothetical protein n=1 Tax=Paenibacillus contaminans TaxID=450362 RepID=UPI001EDEF30E